MKLTWTEPQAPGPDCPYDNTEAETPFGRYQITWKSWKDYPGFCIEFQNDFVTVESTLDDAKEAAQNDFDKRLTATDGATIASEGIKWRNEPRRSKRPWKSKTMEMTRSTA